MSEKKPQVAWIAVLLLAPLLVATLAAVVVVALLATVGDWEPEGELHGSVHAEVFLQCDNPGPDDLEVLGARLEALGVDHILAEMPTGAQLQLHEVRSVEEVLEAVLPRRVFTIQPEDEDSEQFIRDCTEWARDPGPDGCGHIAVGAVEIDSTHIAQARVTWDENKAPLVAASFTPEGARRLADLTTRRVGERIVLAIDGELVSAPVVREPIRGGEVRVEMGQDPADAHRDAMALEAAFSAQPLQGNWTRQ